MKRISIVKRQTLINAAIVFLLAAGGAFALWQQNNPGSLNESDQLQQDEKQEESANNREGQDDPEDSTEPAKTKDDGTPIASGDEEETKQQSLSVVISSLSQDAERIYLTAIISGVKSGNCSLAFSKSDSNTIKRVGEIKEFPPYRGDYGCSFNLPKDALPVKGVWTAVVSVDSSGEVAKSDGESINVY